MRIHLSPHKNARKSVDAKDTSFFEHSTVLQTTPEENLPCTKSQVKVTDETSFRKRNSSGEALGFFELFELHEQAQHSFACTPRSSSISLKNEDQNALTVRTQSQKNEARLTECFSLSKNINQYNLEPVSKASLSQKHLYSVWRASFRSTKKTFAVKFLPTPSKQQHSEKNRWSMRSEIDLHKKMKHPYIARLCGFLKNIPLAEETSKTACALIVEYVPHGSLDSQLKSAKIFGKCGFDEKSSLGIIAQICSALRYMHNVHHAVHCDVKLANILYDIDRKIVKLIDFGLAVDIPHIRRCSTSSSADNFNQLQLLRRGTLNYLSPEQVNGTIEYAQLCKIDIWAVGICAYELIMGFSPFEMDSEGMTRRIICNGRVSFKSASTPPSDAAVSFICTCLQKDPRKRPSIDALMKHRWLNQDISG